MKKTFLALFIFLLLIISVSCNKCNKEKSAVQKVEISENDSVKIKIHRYEKDLFAVDIKNLRSGLKKLLPEYSFFIPDSALNDSSSILQMRQYLTDPFIIILYDDVLKLYPDVNDLETQLGKALTYFKHYYPEKKTPEVFTCVSGLYYEEPIRYSDSLLIISLDMYMGSKYKYYKEMLLGVPVYVQKRFSSEYILPDCMRAIATTIVDNSKENKQFIDYIIYEGKILYFLDATLPDTPDSLKIYYSKSQMDWCVKNESNIWSYIIDNKLLYSSNASLIAKLCTDGPFTSVFSKESPARTGIWIGWQIVRAYMENNKKITLQQLFENQDAQGVLTKAKYKPKK